MSTDNFGALGADFFIKTFDKGSTMSQADLDALVQYVQLTTTIMAIGDFTPNEQDSVWMILERVDVPSAPGYTVTNNTDVTMTSGGMVTIDSIPWTKITGKPVLFSGDYNDLTNKPTLFTANQSLNTGSSVSFNRLTVTGATGIEGGEIQLAKAPSSSLAGDVIIDIYDNKIRFFESGGTSRGFYLDLSTGGNNTNTNIMSGGSGGAQGPKGDTGDTGAAGAQGPKGDTGDTGPAGPKGDTGAQGLSGLEGETGPKGETGDTGAAGAQGPKGDTGDTGPAGPKGDTGDTGAAGAQGPAGNDGAAGAQGEPGAAGAQGPAGNDGAPGADGADGAQGLAGNDGAPGQGVPTGGTVGQVLAKIDSTDYNTEWVNQTSGGPTNEITNTDGNNIWSVSVGTDGVVTMTTARGGLEFGALPEPGGPTHFHIMRPANENGSGGTDLYFGDDYNYVLQRPAAYGQAPGYGVEIGANDRDGGSQQVWRFGTDGTLTLPGNYSIGPGEGSLGIISESAVAIIADSGNSNQLWIFGTDGDLVLPAGKTIRDTSGVDLFADPSTGDPAYKGFKAHYGRMWGNSDDPNGPINKIVIYKDTATPSSTIDASTNNDDFAVTGLTDSDVVVMLVAIGEDVNQTTTAELKTFAESIIDNVILDGGVEGDINTAAEMKTAFYDNFATFSATLTDLKTGFEFFSVNNQFNISPQFETGKGATFNGISYNMSNDTLGEGSWGQGAGTHQVGDVFVIPGNTIQDANSNFLSTPANDVTITITTAPDGYIGNFTVTGTLPRPTEIWPSNSIDDGGDDEYDTGNYITTNLESNISYNDGNVVSGSSAFGGGDYVVTYQNSIFGVFAVNSAIDGIATDGSSGMNGYGQADTGSLYGAANSGVSIGDFVFTNSTMTASDDDLYIKAVDDLWLDALDDDVHIRANDDVRIKTGYNFQDDNAESEWRFTDNGIINFPDGSQQSTAYTGDYDDLTNKPTIPTSFSSLVNDTKTVSLGTDGVLTLPEGGTISEGGGLTGAIKLTPAGGANEYQALMIYPTAAGDGDHIHLTAGGGTTELYLGNDLHYVKIENGGNVVIQSVDGADTNQWLFESNGALTLPVGGDILDSTGASVLGGGTTLPADASGYLVNDGTGALSWAAGDGTFSGDYDDLTNKPTLFDGDYNSLTNKPTYRVTVSAGSGPGGNNQADSLVLAGLNPVTDIPSTWGGDLILQGGAGGANTDLYGEVRIKSGQIGANYEWHFTTDKKIKLPAGGDIVDSTGASVLGGSFSGSYTDLTNKPTIPADVSDLTDTTSLLGGGGTTLPTDASGYLNNNGSGTLTWVAGNPAGSGALPYSDVVVFSNTVTGDWTTYTLSGTMDAIFDYNNWYATITLSSEATYGKQITPNTKTLWINDAKINSNNYIVIEFPASPTVGDVFTVPMVSETTTVNAGFFVVGDTYTILSVGNTNWTNIGAQYGGTGQSFIATGIGSGTGTATTAVGAKKVIFKPASGQRAQTMSQGSVGPLVFGQGGTYNFAYVDVSGQNASSPLTWVYAGVINSIPTWYQFYF